MNKIIDLSTRNISEINDIIRCLNSKDRETFELGKTIISIIFPHSSFIPVRDTLIPLDPYLEVLTYPDALTCSYISKYTHLEIKDLVCELLEILIYNKYYVVPQNNT